MYTSDLRSISTRFTSYYIKGDHIRLNEIYLGYDLPERWLSRQNVFRRVNVYAQASNLGVRYGVLIKTWIPTIRWAI